MCKSHLGICQNTDFCTPSLSSHVTDRSVLGRGMGAVRCRKRPPGPAGRPEPGHGAALTPAPAPALPSRAPLGEPHGAAMRGQVLPPASAATQDTSSLLLRLQFSQGKLFILEKMAHLEHCPVSPAATLEEKHSRSGKETRSLNV